MLVNNLHHVMPFCKITFPFYLFPHYVGYFERPLNAVEDLTPYQIPLQNSLGHYFTVKFCTCLEFG